MNSKDCGILIKQINTALEKSANHALKTDDMTISQITVLMTMREQPEQKISFKELEKKLQIAQSTTVGLISRLERKGLVESVYNKEDKRTKWAVMTRKGVEMCRVADQRMKDTENLLLSGLKEQEKEPFLDMLSRVANSMNQG